VAPFTGTRTSARTCVRVIPMGPNTRCAMNASKGIFDTRETIIAARPKAVLL